MVGKSGSPHGGATRATIALQHFPGWVAAAVAAAWSLRLSCLVSGNAPVFRRCWEVIRANLDRSNGLARQTRQPETEEPFADWGQQMNYSTIRWTISVLFVLLLAGGAIGADAAKETGRDGRFIVYDNDTVRDTKTNLMWAAKDNGRALSWPDAKSFSTDYRSGGYSDWRLPTVDELKGLYDTAASYKTACTAALDEHSHIADEVHLTKAISLTCTRLWTSQARSGAPGSVLVFDFHYGSDAARPGFQGFIDTAVRVLPVRSGK
jgi:hypothetical protein